MYERLSISVHPANHKWPEHCYTPGVDWGRPLIIRHRFGQFWIVRREGHSTFMSRGAQEYAPTKWMLLRVLPGKCGILLDIEPGRKVKPAEEMLIRTAKLWNERGTGPARQTLVLKKGVISHLGPGGEEAVEIDRDTHYREVVNFLVRSGVSPLDIIELKGRPSKGIQGVLDRAFDALEPVLSNRG